MYNQYYARSGSPGANRGTGQAFGRSTAFSLLDRQQHNSHRTWQLDAPLRAKHNKTQRSPGANPGTHARHYPLLHAAEPTAAAFGFCATYCLSRAHLPLSSTFANTRATIHVTTCLTRAWHNSSAHLENCIPFPSMFFGTAFATTLNVW